MQVSSTTTSSSSLRGFAWCVIFTLAVSACRDADTGPLALAVASETHGAVLFGDGLPTVPRLLAEQGMEDSGSIESGVWSDSWTLPGPKGADLRTQVHASAAQQLAPVLGSHGVSDVLDRVSTSIRIAQALVSTVQSAELSQTFQRARDLRTSAGAALEEEDLAGALVLAFQASDALWELTPQQVAFGLIQTASEALGRKPHPASYSQEELTRIRRLVYGALESFDDKDYPRAIRRAYYACQLLGEGPP